MEMSKCRIISRVKMILKLSLCILGFYMIYEVFVKDYRILNISKSRSKVVLKYRLVHLDLKGAPPKLEYLETVLPVLKKAGANGLLMEYEDMFPYEGRVGNLSAHNCYGREKLSSFLESATKMGFEIIPLIQTFGHLEMALKLREFRRLREEDDSPDSICPNRFGSMELIMDMITQIMDFHSKLMKIRWLHIGCDEVFHINLCRECQQRNLTNFEIFHDHISKLSEKISSKYPELKLIIWDDMLRATSSKTMDNTKFRNNIELMVWVYGPVIKTIIPYHTMYKYIQNFEHIWIASAFKGANNPNSIIPDLKNRYQNNLAWLNYTNEFKISKHRESVLYKFEGIALTGWSRFNHFASLCELLPNSLPSVLMNLALIEEFTETNSQSCINCYELHKNVYHKSLNRMDCDVGNIKIDTVKFQHIKELEISLGNCKFDGNNLYETLIRLDEFKLSIIRSYLSKQFEDRNVLDPYLSPESLSNIDSSVIHHFSIKDKSDFLKYLVIKLREILVRYYDVYTIEEYVKSKTDPLFDMLNNLTGNAKKKTFDRVWKRRPQLWGKIKFD